jgi:serine/threonine-protein kinase
MAHQFGKYLLLKRLALGGMAEIWLAKQLGVQGFEKLVVVKRILDQFAGEKEFVEMFLDEARLAASLNHPNVVQIYDLGQEQRSFFIAMEFIAGHDLFAILRKCKQSHTPLPPEIAARMVAGACEGLHYAHTRRDNRGNPLNIVHRDVSPSNILVTYDGGVKVVDFGIAKAESQSTKTEAGRLKGKYSYMSPEQIRSEPLDGRSDVFALGIVLHEILVGRRLFKRENELAIMQDILDGEVRRPSALRADIPAALDEIVLKALQKDRRKRFANAQEMQVALEKFLSGASEPPTSLHVSNFVMRLFADEHAAYQRLLQELPTAAPEELADLLADSPGTASGSNVSGLSSDPGNVPPRVSAEPEPEAVRRPSRRKGSAALFGGLAALAVLVATGGFLLLRPSAPPPPTVGEVSVETDPPGAVVVLNGSRTSVRTPGTLPGLALEQDHKVRLELEGHESREVTVRLSPQLANKAVSVALPVEKPRPGALEVVTEPPGAQVVLDGNPQPGVTPLTLPEVTAGVEHTVRLSLEGYQDEAATVRVEPKATAQVKLTLKAKVPEPQVASASVSEPRGKKGKRGGGGGVAAEGAQTGEVQISSTPQAEILLSGRSLGQTPATVSLPAGKVSLTLVNRDLELRQTVSVQVEPKGRTQSSFTFRKGKLAADATPWADVYIGDRKLGTTPLAPREVYEGSYTVRLVNSELGAIKTKKVVVEPGKTTVVREAME